jgi:cytochrome c-type biogenesis protein CcmF
VENASLLPWLTATAFLHATLGRAAGRAGWNLALACASFVLVLLGTFLTRSGAVASVHAFTDSPLGPMLLGFVLLTVVVSTVLTGWRDPEPAHGRSTPLLSRTTAVLVNGVLLVTIAAVVLIGTVFPLLSEPLGGVRTSVGPGYYQRTAVPLAIAVLLMMGVTLALRVRDRRRRCGDSPYPAPWRSPPSPWWGCSAGPACPRSARSARRRSCSPAWPETWPAGCLAPAGTGDRAGPPDWSRTPGSPWLRWASRDPPRTGATPNEPSAPERRCGWPTCPCAWSAWNAAAAAGYDGTGAAPAHRGGRRNERSARLRATRPDTAVTVPRSTGLLRDTYHADRGRPGQRQPTVRLAVNRSLAALGRGTLTAAGTLWRSHRPSATPDVVAASPDPVAAGAR